MLDWYEFGVVYVVVVDVGVVWLYVVVVGVDDVVGCDCGCCCEMVDCVVCEVFWLCDVFGCEYGDCWLCDCGVCVGVGVVCVGVGRCVVDCVWCGEFDVVCGDEWCDV